MTDRGSAMIEVVGLRHDYGNAPVLQIDHWTLARGAVCCVTGPSGSGKTTFLDMLCALRRPTAGTVSVGGVSLAALGERQADRWRGQTVGVVSQVPHLFEWLSALENVEMSSTMARVPASRARALALLDQQGIVHLADQRADRLSVGQRQRVAVARALLLQPPLVVADEPTANLDDLACDDVLEALMKASTEGGTTIVLSSHDDRVKQRIDRRLHLTATVASRGTRRT
ncbi:MAG: ATP-binding cassette domain-containing protein [Hydrogenophaga sp.]|nr:ATP-binding cassette domain-containing protein [Hydrogenophaga sp.]